MKALATLLMALLCVTVQPAALRAEDRSPAAGRPVFVPIAPLVVPVIHAGEVRVHLVYVVQLEVGDAAAGARIAEMMPRLRDAYLRALAGMADRVGAGDPPDIERVKRSLGAASDRVLGPHVVREVLVQRSFTRRPS